MTRRTTGRPVLFLLAGLLAWLGGCAPAERMTRPADRTHAPEPIAALPDVPAHDGPLDIRLAYPQEGLQRPDADSTFVFGTVGTGRARLTINGLEIPVAPNGAFLAFVPVPRDGAYHFAARAGDRTDAHVYRYAPPPPPRLNVRAYERPRMGTVTAGRDTLASGSQITSGGPTPTADRRWFFPRGTRLVLTGEMGDQVRVRLTDRTEAWVPAADVTVPEGDSLAPAPPPLGAPTVQAQGRVVDVRISAGHAPFLVTPLARQVELTLYNRPAPTAPPALAGDFIEAARWQAIAADSAHLVLQLREPLWGFKAYYEEDGTLVLRLRRPPPIDAAEPVRGVRILIDPGHPPGGAIGPTGFTEAEANLQIARRLADLLRAKGADVRMTRTTGETIASSTSSATELWARVDLAVAQEADLLVSVHNNAFPDGVNPFEHYGTETYYYHPFSAGLAEALLREIVPVTGLPNMGAKPRSLALVRPTWMPSTLTESLFMMFPQQEAALRDPGFLDRLAAAHLRGIEAFLRTRGGDR